MIPTNINSPSVTTGRRWPKFARPCPTFITGTTTSAVTRRWATPRLGLHSPYRRTLVTPLEEFLGALPLALYDSPDPGIPVPTVDLLLLNKAERRDRFLADLAADRVISYGQLRRHYGLDDHDLDRVPFVETVLQPMHMRKALEVKTRFFLGQKSLQSMSDHSLMHLAGTGEMRRILGVPTGEYWRVNARHVHASQEPDAVFRSPHGEVAVEFDVGTYSMNTIQKKLEAFHDSAYLETVWGVTSTGRQRNLQEEIGSQLKRDILLADWWSGLPNP